MSWITKVSPDTSTIDQPSLLFHFQLVYVVIPQRIYIGGDLYATFSVLEI